MNHLEGTALSHSHGGGSSAGCQADRLAQSQRMLHTKRKCLTYATDFAGGSRDPHRVPDDEKGHAQRAGVYILPRSFLKGREHNNCFEHHVE